MDFYGSIYLIYMGSLYLLGLSAVTQNRGLPWWLSGKEPACQWRRRRLDSLGWEDPLEKGMAIHSSILAWKIP